MTYDLKMKDKMTYFSAVIQIIQVVQFWAHIYCLTMLLFHIVGIFKNQHNLTESLIYQVRFSKTSLNKTLGWNTLVWLHRISEVLIYQST